MDYLLNWDFYFGQPWNKKSQVDIIFIAGAYMSSEPSNINKNIKLAEQHSIELWNRGYKVFCPHLNTQNFEVKSEAKEDAYKEFDMIMLQCCDAIFALPSWKDISVANEEIEEAMRLGKPIFYSLDELPTKKKK